ncbi:phosphatidylcholine:diacylglycerol cholinephosphotransferase 1 isoform X1 [Populus alba]|uniref:Phosphatidylcholine:diacylglycerol cholinephosphotransferase 1-like isoform X1 n=2 Tax=Populus TaxID=3689 RepID=A0A4U5MZV4_POPAL|nr:phosphatidylcholine:diacylglycerol cholinephosphotransferase 1-like isoform X1 [Populus alba]KAJ7012090.1 phosphatidylcholine:diacylglycerol cholinephosphotransferase 1-like isoform X1 [Populus alba x Populus x berolinensis]TKR75540.1 phosphatidylcholine:diacylglycerol cholinephosphotransferase 1-like isoform X1 [Populus alba]
MKTTTSATITATIPTPYKRKQINVDGGFNMEEEEKKIVGIMTDGVSNGFYGVDPFFLKWTVHDMVNVAKHHWLPCFFGFGLLFFMAVEYTLPMVPASSPPFDLGFVVTRRLHGLLSSWPELNTLLAALNTVFVGMQTTYILWTWLVEGRPRATISALFMFTCRGILGYSTQLPLPEEFLGSGADFPVGNVSFFLFFSGHVAGSVIASLDMRRMQRWELAWTFDVLNALQVIRLLGTRGHYTIDLVVGVGAGILFDSLAGKYQECIRSKSIAAKEAFFS